jgi:hypothetical protein
MTAASQTIAGIVFSFQILLTSHYSSLLALINPVRKKIKNFCAPWIVMAKKYTFPKLMF